MIVRRLGYKYGFKLQIDTEIGRDFYIGHFGTIVINSNTKTEKNCNISYNTAIRKNGAALSTIITLFIIAILSIHLSTKLIGKTLLDYFDIPRVLKLTLAAFALYFSFLLFNLLLNDWWGVALVIQLLISYYVILKFNFIDRSILLALTSKIPIINKFLTKLVHKI